MGRRRTAKQRGVSVRASGSISSGAKTRARIKRSLNDHSIEPAPERATKTPWNTLLAAHWDGHAAADFFTVKALTMGGLVRHVVFFVMILKTRAVEIAGITSPPDEAWMTQVAWNLTDARYDFLRGCSPSSSTETRSTPRPCGACCGVVA